MKLGKVEKAQNFQNFCHQDHRLKGEVALYLGPRASVTTLSSPFIKKMGSSGSSFLHSPGGYWRGHCLVCRRHCQVEVQEKYF